MKILSSFYQEKINDEVFVQLINFFMPLVNIIIDAGIHPSLLRHV